MFFENEGVVATLDGRKGSKLLSQTWSQNFLWIPSITNVQALSSGDNQGGYDVMCKVQIERFNYIPNTIELVGKTPKTNEKQKVCKQHLVKAIVCPCKHLGVIKFLAIYLNTMEAYTLWWNGNMLRKMLNYNTKYPPILNNQVFLWQKGLDMEG
jgi:hypothetical protein